jgi:hypothetical protein
MKILMSLVLIVLILLTSGIHVYFVWKKGDRRTLYTQLSLLGLTIIAGILGVWGVTEPSISTLINGISPFKK